MSLRLIIVTLLLWGLAINQSFGQTIADFNFDDTSDEPFSLQINRVGKDAISINENARSDGEGVYTLVDQSNPDEHQNIDLIISKDMVSDYPSLYMEWEFRCQEENAWLINGGDSYHSGIFHHDQLGFNIRYYTQGNPGDEPTFYHTNFSPPQIPPLERDVKYRVGFYYSQDEGIAYLFIDGQEVWRSTSHFPATPGEALYWNTEEELLKVGAGMDGEASTIPSLYRFRIMEQPCPDIEMPALVQAETTIEVCMDEPAMLKVSGGEEGNYRWYESENATEPLNGAVGSEFTSPPLAESRSYFVSVVEENCESERLEIPVEVISAPDPPQVEAARRCGPGELILKASGSSDSNYRWYDREQADTPIPGAENSEFATGPLSQNKTYYVSIAGPRCESEPVAVEAVIEPEPARPADQELSRCGPGEVEISLDDINSQYLYRWYSQPGGNTPQHENNEGTFTVTVSQDTTIYVRSSNGLCESESATIQINVLPLPDIDAGPDTTILKGQSIELQARLGNYSFRWEPHESLEDPKSANPTVTPEFTHVYVVTATTDDGCELSDKVTVYVIDDFPVPNAFSPNNDGINDNWEIPNIETYPDCRVLIFNRWGNQVFSSDGYTEPWDGTDNGNPLPSGTYYYTIQLSNERELIKGSVVIMR